MDCYVGIDVSLRSCAVCIIDGKGKILFEQELPCEVEDINEWTCPTLIPHPVLVYATFRSNAMGVLPPNVEWRRRGL